MNLRLLVELEGRSQSEVIDMIDQYNKYVVNYYDTHEETDYPVSFPEFLENDYETPLERLSTTIFDEVKYRLEKDDPEEDILDNIYLMLSDYIEEYR